MRNITNGGFPTTFRGVEVTAIGFAYRRVYALPAGPLLLKLALLIFIALLGVAAALGLDVHHLERQPWLYGIALGFVAVGIYIGMAGIPRDTMRRNLLFTAIALGGGVLLKYAIIATVTYSVTGNWAFLVWSMLMVAIDPLSVAAVSATRMGEDSRTILMIWAGGDDPISMLFSPLAFTIVVAMTGQDLQRAPQGGDWVTLLPFAAALVLAGAWGLLKSRVPPRTLDALSKETEDRTSRSLLVVWGTAFFSQSLTTIAAMLGLFVRFKFIERYGAWLSNLVLAAATFILGLLLADGFEWQHGMLLGAAVYISQIITAWSVALAVWLIKRRDTNHAQLTVRDVWHLALGQQNGITAIVLLLSMEPFIDGTVAVGASAIVFVNLTYFVVNALFDRIDVRIWPEATLSQKA